MSGQVALTKALIRTRAHEALAYLRFLKIACEKDALVTAISGKKSLPLHKGLTHTLKAGLCLILYSAMEAALVQLLDEMYEAIGNHCRSTDELNAQTLLLVARHFKSRSADIDSGNTHTPLNECLFQIWRTDWANSNSREKRSASISGSVDSKAISDQLRRFGVLSAASAAPAHLSHNALQTMKFRRNQLAHGDQSFAELGQSLSYQELCIDARNVFRVLAGVAKEVEMFLTDKRYRRTSTLSLPLPNAA